MLMSEDILTYLPANISRIIKNVMSWLEEELLEIRLRVNQPLQIVTQLNDYFLTDSGKRADSPGKAYRIMKTDLKKAMLIITNNSIYAVERQLVEGFITIPGGHRVGFTGQAVMDKGKGEIKTIKNINSLNYRITRQVIGVAEKVIEKIYDMKNDCIYNTLIISPPLCGKTTLLRDLVRALSQGMPELGIHGKKIGVVDERSEIGGAYNGIPQNKIGYRTDLLDNCPKARGMLILIRSMSPEIIAVDEIGREEDVRAIGEAINAGVNLITTVHGIDLRGVKNRPSLASLIKTGVFKRYIILSKRMGIGTVERVIDSDGEEVE